MRCPFCQAENEEQAEACFTCGRALFALTQGTLLGGRYEILRLLGGGGMGIVYEAFDRVLEESVAIKVLRAQLTRDAEMARRFRSEIKLARKVSHPNVCRIHEYGESDTLAYISMEFVEGWTLKQLLSDRRLGPAEALDLASQVAEGLRAVHDHGIVHRDLKPSNVMIDRRGVAKLMDFGIAKKADARGLTTSGVIGTPEYMSPEQARGDAVDLRSDLYALGCVVFEAFAGTPPFRADTPLETLRRQAQEPPPLDVPGLPSALKPVLSRALAKSRADRYASAGELALALRRAAAALGLPEDARALAPGAAGALAWPWTDPLSSPALAPTGTLRSMRLRWARLRARLGAGFPALLAAAAILVGLLSLTRPTPPRDAAAAAGRAASAPVPPRGSPSPASTVAKSPPHEPAAPPRPTLVDEPSSRSSPAPRNESAPPTAEPRSPGGTLSLLVVPESEVLIDGRDMGRASIKEFPLATGPHLVRILHPDYEPYQRKVTVHANEVTKLVLDLAEKGIRRQN